MATIEERAFASMSTRKREQIDNNAPKEKFIGDVYINGYCNGAKEQRKIDIDKACEWLSVNWDISDYNSVEEFVGDFRKAMISYGNE